MLVEDLVNLIKPKTDKHREYLRLIIAHAKELNLTVDWFETPNPLLLNSRPVDLLLNEDDARKLNGAMEYYLDHP